MCIQRKLSRCILPLLLMIALLFPLSASAVSPVLPEFGGAAAIELNRNIPVLPESGADAADFVVYSPLDEFGRPGAVTACISRDCFPIGLRGDSADVLPVGWVTARYDGEYLYSLCHLLSPALGGDAAAENVFTGTRYLRNESMRPYEDTIADYIMRTANHVLYRVTPVYDGECLVPTGVQLEARSVEDAGRSVCFNVFLYNVRPGIAIDYSTGESAQDDSVVIESTAKDLIGTHFYPEPSQMLAPQHGSFGALNEEYQKSISVSGVQQQSVSIPTTVYIPNNGRADQHYHASSDCSDMTSPLPLSFESVRRKYEPCPKCWTEEEYQYLMSIYRGTITLPSSSSPSKPVSAASPQPVSTPAPTANPQPSGNSLLSGILSSALSTDNTMVWLSSMDHCYHSSDSCPNVDPLSASQRTLDWAKINGYEPCSQCW